ncbi:MAG: helix-turn-helix transcriptional regulator [Campylobacteraceae bacterium]|nr:helix-turn-helix transcriptional regulator [Campylobacteraceae bacterium]
MNNKLKDLNFSLFIVDKKIELYVQSYWQVKCTLEKTVEYLLAPDGAMGLIVNLGNKIKIKTEKKTYDLEMGEILLLGIHEHAVSVVLENNCNLLGIRFNPAGAFCFFKNDYSNLYQNNILIKENSLYKRLAKEDKSIEEVFNSYLLSLFKEDSKIKSFVFMLKKIEEDKGIIEIEELSSLLNISRRSIDRLFKKYLGISANIYLRIIKIKYSREELRNVSFDTLTNVGYNNGYFDQSHFIREFKTFMQKSPKQYVKEKKTLS